jgi:heme exporter protein B
MFREIQLLLHKDFKLEFRQKFMINSLMLYALATVFVCYLAFQQSIPKEAWNALFWIIILFSAIQMASKTFIQEGVYRQVYYYSISSPEAIILSKMIYNSVLMLFISSITFLFYYLFLGNYIIHFWIFFLVLTLGSLGLSAALTLVAAISSRSGNSFALMAILSFPVVLPLLLIVIQLSLSALNPEISEGLWKNILAISLLDVIIFAMAFFLFPFLWKD